QQFPPVANFLRGIVGDGVVLAGLLPRNAARGAARLRRPRTPLRGTVRKIILAAGGKKRIVHAPHPPLDGGRPHCPDGRRSRSRPNAGTVVSLPPYASRRPRTGCLPRIVATTRPILSSAARPLLRFRSRLAARQLAGPRLARHPFVR